MIEKDANGIPQVVEDVKGDSNEVEATQGIVNAPITWGQALGAWLTDGPLFLLAALPIIATWLQGDQPITSRGLITIAILAIVAGLTAVMRVTGTDGLSLRLRSNGQIDGGK